MKRITTPFKKDEIRNLKIGQYLHLRGFIYTARDQAHKRLVALLEKGKELPLDLKGQVIYYCGPTPSRPGSVIGSSGPTTSERMDSFIEPLLKAGLIGMVGKGKRSSKAVEVIKRYRGVYFVAPSGCGALLSEKVVSKELIAFKELGPEAIYRLEVKDFPLIVGIDSEGNDLYGQRR